jgi:flagellar FliJ protein
MKPFSFALEPLLEYRSFELDKIERELSLKNGKLALLREELEKNARETLRIGYERFQKSNTMEDMRSYENYSLKLTVQKEKLLKAIAMAELELEKVRAAWTEANKKKKVLEKLREKKYNSWKVEKSRIDTAILDEFGSVMYERSLKA